ncbi:MAG: hypothetical protein NZ700_02425 [Gemmataceae bacterium]|nr:hypothetical protein [Gemmataceae bacterium]MDW8264688.1 hypothetical protein [Gemmataceae bacterium]
MSSLPARLAALRRGWRLVVGLRGLLAVLAVLSLGGLSLGLLDWRWHLPSLVRAVGLVGLLTAAGVAAYRLILQPWRDRTDDLSLALRIEEKYPELNDALASTVQFLQQTGGSPASAADLRQLTVQQTLLRTQDYDFTCVLDRRGLWRAAAGAALASFLVLFVGLRYPSESATAFVRLTQPFGDVSWPPQTRMTVTARPRVAQGEPFEFEARLEGVIPQRATVVYRWDRGQVHEQVWTVQHGSRPDEGLVRPRLEADRVRRSFEFEVRAHDGRSGWHAVTVLPPPRLVALDGRPSPQVRLTYPAYTDLPPRDLTDGTGHIEAVVGTHVRFRAAVDRPIVRAWIEYRPEPSVVTPASLLTPLGANHWPAAAALAAAGREVWSTVPVRLDSTGQRLEANFLPRISGAYALRLEDDTGLVSTRLFDLRLQPDPAPTVHLERPSPSLDSLSVLPTAEITVAVVAEDPQYAVRRVDLEYRCAEGDPPRLRPLYDPEALAQALPPLFSGLAARPWPLPGPAPRLRPTRLTIVQRLPLRQLRHADGRPLREGDVVTLQARADDYDTVALAKAPGRSAPIELRIVGTAALEALLNQAQSAIQQELTRLREQQGEARQKVEAAEKQWRHTGRLRPEDLDALLQAEQVQQQIRARVGTRADEGVRGEVARVRQMLEDNHLPRSGTHERMEWAAAELQRLAEEELDLIEPLLAEARKAEELGGDGSTTDPRTARALAEAGRHQDEVAKTLNELLARLQPWSKVRELKAEARSLLEEQRQLNAQTGRLARELPLGRPLEALTPEQRAELERAADAQARHAEHVDQLLGKMDRLAADRQRQAAESRLAAAEKRAQADEKQRQAEAKELLALEEEPKAPERAQKLREEARNLRQEAEQLAREAESQADAAQTMLDEMAALREAAERGRHGESDRRLAEAARSLRTNKLGDASVQQRAGTASLEEVVQALEERRERELDRLVKRLREAEKQLLELEEEQERLRQKAQEAARLADARQRERELQRLAREQEKLRQRAQRLTEELSRLRAERAGQALGQAGADMEDAGQQLTRAQAADEAQDEALDRLEEARREVERARRQVEDELAREKLVKVADQLQRLKERQEAAMAEAARLHETALQRKRWDRGLVSSLADLARAQGGLAQETVDLADQKLTAAEVAAHVVRKSAEAMRQAEQRLVSWRQAVVERRGQGDALNVPEEEAAAAEVRRWQEEARGRLEQLLAVVEPARRGRGGAAASGGGAADNAAAGPESDGIPTVAQLRLLRTLQEEINHRTEEFARNHPDVTRLTPAAQAELDQLRRDQRDIADLLDRLTAPREGTTP